MKRSFNPGPGRIVYWFPEGSEPPPHTDTVTYGPGLPPYASNGHVSLSSAMVDDLVRAEAQHRERKRRAANRRAAYVACLAVLGTASHFILAAGHPVLALLALTAGTAAVDRFPTRR